MKGYGAEAPYARVCMHWARALRARVWYPWVACKARCSRVLHARCPPRHFDHSALQHKSVRIHSTFRAWGCYFLLVTSVRVYVCDHTSYIHHTLKSFHGSFVEDAMSSRGRQETLSLEGASDVFPSTIGAKGPIDEGVDWFWVVNGNPHCNRTNISPRSGCAVVNYLLRVGGERARG